MRISTLSALAGLLISVFISAVFMTADGKENLRENILRLHIPANSDSAADQEVKIKVRDKILLMSEEIFAGKTDRDEILLAAENNLQRFENAADEILSENGFPYKAHAELADMYFDDRTYDSFFVPHGEYTALRITLGSGRGKNWWCVMYPALCLPCFSENTGTEEIISDSSISEEGEKILNSSESQLEIKFFLVEFIEELIN